MDAISKFLESRIDARNTYTSEDNLHMTRDGFMIPPPPPGPENLPILGGNIYQGFDPDVEMSVPVQEVPGKNDPSRRLLELMSPAAELLSKDFGAAFQQYRIAELEKYIDDGTLEPIDYQLAVIENPTVPLGDYYDAAANAFFGVPSDDYILHLGQLYPRRFTDQSSGEEVDLSEDSMLMNLGRYVMSAFMTDPLGVGTSAIAPAARLVRSAMGDTTDSNVLASGIVPSGVPSTEAADVSDIGFYSAVNRAVEALPMEKGSASQMRSMIAKAEGVKPEEMAWIGLDDFLKGKKSVTKAEVQDYVQANQVQLEEVTKRGDLPQRTADEWQDLIDNAEAQGDWDAADALTQQWEAAEGLGGTAYPDSPKFASYTLPGGENYREVLLTLPERGGPVDDRTPLQTAKDLFGDNIESISELHLDQRDILQRELDKQYKQGEKRLADNFTGGHFDEPNILAHMRLNDRTGPNGERILFIEEIQSDWHQKGRKAGYKNFDGVVDIKEIDGRLTTEQGFSATEVTETTENFTTTNWEIRNPDDEVIEILNNETAAREALRVRERGGGALQPGFTSDLGQVPDAPMKKTWHEMSFRRVARMAAEEGYDAIAWTPGKMQAERYDLSTQISTIGYSGTTFKAYDLDGQEVISRTGVQPDDLPELIGKEAADKLMAQPAKSGLRVLAGEQLEVGGEGMKGFYDKMLKNYAAKWGKKFGAKVGVSSINADGPASVLEAVRTPNGFVVMDRVNGGQVANFETQQAADNFIKNEMADTEVWTLPVTKKMRDSIMKKGVPLFAAGGAAVMSQVEGERNGN